MTETITTAARRQWLAENADALDALRIQMIRVAQHITDGVVSGDELADLRDAITDHADTLIALDEEIAALRSPCSRT